jgi:hypothetical protein
MLDAAGVAPVPVTGDRHLGYFSATHYECDLRWRSRITVVPGPPQGLVLLFGQLDGYPLLLRFSLHLAREVIHARLRLHRRTSID